jgi:hypothetical protein
VAAYVAEYIWKAFSGDVTGAAKSLARGLAVGAIELVFALLFNIGAVIKSMKAGLTASLKAIGRSATRLVTGTVKNIRQLGRIGVKAGTRLVSNIRRAGAVFVRNGKIMMQGLERGFSRGVRSLDDLAKRLWDRLRFRRFKVRKAGLHIQLWGYINPWILLADGTVEEISFAGSGRRPTLGAAAEKGGRPGFLVGIRDTDASSFVRHLDTMDDASRRALFQELEAMDEAARRVAIQGIGQTAENARILRASMTQGGAIRAGRGVPGGGNAAHHIVPSTHGYSSAVDARKILTSCGIDINHALNGVFVPPKIHAHLHTKIYMDAVLDALGPLEGIADIAARRARAEAILDNLAQRILARRFTP